MQAATTTAYPVMCLFTLCDYVITIHQHHKQMDGHHASIVRESCICMSR